MVNKNFTLIYDTDGKNVFIGVAVVAEQTSVSHIYVTAHLAKSANPAKSIWEAVGQGDCSVEQIYDRDDGQVELVINVTAGAGTYPVQVNAISPQHAAGSRQQASGLTGTPVTLTF